MIARSGLPSKPLAGLPRARHDCTMRFPVPALALSVMFAAVPPASAGELAVIGPLTGRDAWLGRSMSETLTPVLGAVPGVIDDGCSMQGGAAAARRAASDGARIVVGLPCIDALDGAAPILSAAGIPVLVPGIRAADITRPPRGTDEWTVFRTGPRLENEAAVLGAYLAQAWRDVPVAIIDDGTLYGRLIAEGVRAELEARALSPVFTDTFRPLLDNQVALVRRIVRSGATHVVVGGEARDAAVIARSADIARVRLTLAGGSYLIAPSDDGRLPDGTIAVDVPAQTDLVAVAALIAREALESGDPLAALRTQSFDTPAGPVRFDASGEPDRSFLSILIFSGGVPLPVQATD